MKALNYIKDLLEVTKQKDFERVACNELIIKCERKCADSQTSESHIFRPLNNLCQFMIRIRKKGVDYEKLENKTIKRCNAVCNRPKSSKIN